MPSLFSPLLNQLEPVMDQLILAGGFAVNHHGYTRNTLDMDLVCSETNLHGLRQQVLLAGYTDIETGPVALHCKHPVNHFRVDLLPVDPATFEKLRLQALHARIDDQHTIPVLCLEHLLAMKIHALACHPAARKDKDLADIAWLAVLNDLDMSNDLLPLCQTYGNETLSHEISDAIRALQA